MNTLFKIVFGKAAALAATGLIAMGLLAAPAPVSQNLGNALPGAPALVDTFLASSIGTTDTSMTLANGKTTDGVSLAGFMCFTIDVNTPTLEYVCGQASGTAITSMTRGIGFWNPNTTSTSLAFVHRRFASVQSTDYPTLQFIVRQLSGVDPIGSGTPLSYDASIPSSSFTNGQQLIDKSYADNLTFSGVSNASVVQKGIVQESTKVQLASGTAVGSTGADLVPNNGYFKASSTATTSVPVTNGSGVLDPAFICQTLACPYSFLGGITNVSTTLATTTYKNQTTAVLATDANGLGYAAGKGASTGSVLVFKNGQWQAGLVFSSTSTSQSNTTTTNRLILSIPIPAASSTSIFEYAYQFNVPNGVNSNATFTVALAGNGVTTTLQTVNTITNCAAGPAFCGAIEAGRIISQGTVSSQLALIYPAGALGDGFTSSSPASFATTITSLNLGVSPSINFYIQAATSTSFTFTASGTLIMYQ